MVKLTYAKAVVSTNDSAEINGVLIFAHPPSIHISFVALYAVEESCRGQGIGRKMWSVMEHNTDSSRIRVIHSYDDMTPKYRASGFPVPGETFKRISGSVSQLKIALEEAISTMSTEQLSTNLIRAIPTEVTIESITEFDRTIVPFERSAFLDAFFSFANGKAIVKSDRDKETVIAYGGTNPAFNENEMKIGPIYATDFNDVILLLHALIVDSTKSHYDLGFPFDSENGQRFAEFLCTKAGAKLGEKRVSRSFSRRLDCKIDWSRVFALSGHYTAPLT
uniref:N-acetyltransferase domain-containing protein n=1 Tax=Plectus sambesii TaxID=2011161 RepID=A0A914XQG2_9BILA